MIYPARIARGCRPWMLLLSVIVLLIAVTSTTEALSSADDWGLPIEPEAWQLQEGAWLTPSEPAPAEFTVRTVVTVNDAFTSQGEALVLAGAATSPDGLPDALRVVWGPSSSGWAVLWSLRLESDQGLLTGAIPGRSGGSVELYSGYPITGHQYETLLGYDARQGVLEVMVSDLTDGKVVYQGRSTVKPDDMNLWLRSAVQTKGAHGGDLVSVDRFGVMSYALPVATTWTVSAISADGRRVSSTQFDATSDILIGINSSSVASQGEYRVLSQTAAQTRVLGVLSDPSSAESLRLHVDDLPTGQSTLILEYIVGDQAFLSESRSVTVGRTTFAVRELKIDRNAQEISGVLGVSSVQQLEGVEVVVEARIHEKVWEQARRDYRNELRAVMKVLNEPITVPAGDELSVPFTISLPQDPGLYELTLVPSTSLGVAIDTLGAYKLFHTYQPADPQPGEPFSIAVLPDTQNYAAEYPTIYIRQMQWIAENAKDKNILLALHLGDITNDNTPLQWQRSVEAITLLDGVVPYVLSQGNHDMTAAGGGNVANRNSSRINQYFPVEKQPWIQGTFEPGGIENSYATFNLGGEDYLVVSLEFGARNEALDWANGVVQAHPKHKVIMITHVYTTRSGRRSTSAEGYDIALNRETTVNNGDQIWARFVSRHPNMLMVLSGHHNSENGISRQVARGIHGNPVYEMMINYQFDTRGGDGHFALFEFGTDNNIEVRAYSPYLDVHRTDVSIFGFNNHFIIDTQSGRYLEAEGGGK